MGYKSRSNYKSGCLKFDCINRDKKCKECIFFSKYKEKETNENKTKKE